MNCREIEVDIIPQQEVTIEMTLVSGVSDGIKEVFHDDTLEGKGTKLEPLSVVTTEETDPIYNSDKPNIIFKQNTSSKLIANNVIVRDEFGKAEIEDGFNEKEIVNYKQLNQVNTDLTSLIGKKIEEVKEEIPTNVSDLENDNNYVDDQYVDDKVNIEKNERIDSDNNLSSKINARDGIGGYLTAYNFGTSNPTEQQLTDYAISQIPNITDKTQIFSGTRVKNLFDNGLWILTNTPTTEPPIFEWSYDGIDTVSVAGLNTLGVVAGSDIDLEVSVNGVTGKMSVNKLAEIISQIQNGYVKSTDYASSTKAGIVRMSNGFQVGQSTGATSLATYTLAQYNSVIESTFIGKGTLENVLADRIGTIETALGEI